MPLDGHSYLVARGWEGHGTGLRHGAITRPLAIPQKKNHAGLGKDRDEAFPFWDHVFTAVAKSIQIKVGSDDEDESDSDARPSAATSLRRTETGILSNRRSEPSTTVSSVQIPQINLLTSLLSSATREAAKKSLYARFHRGPVLGPDIDAEGSLPSVLETADVEGDNSEKRRSKKRKTLPEVYNRDNVNNGKHSQDYKKERREEHKRRKKKKKAKEELAVNLDIGTPPVSGEKPSKSMTYQLEQQLEESIEEDNLEVGGEKTVKGYHPRTGREEDATKLTYTAKKALKEKKRQRKVMQGADG